MNEKSEIKWEINISLLSNKFLIRQMIFLFLITYTIISILMGTIFLAQGVVERIPKTFLIFFLVCSGLFILSILVMFIIFGNKLNLRFTIDKKGVLYEMIDKRAKNLNNLTIILSLLLRKPTYSGTGLIAKSKEVIFTNFKNVSKIKNIDKQKVILLKNEWRTLMAIYCNSENYEMVKNYLNEIFKNREVKVKESIKNPLPKYIVLSILTIIFTIPIFTLQYPFELNIFVPILIMFSTLGAIWILSLLFYVTIGTSFYIIFLIIVRAFEKVELTLLNRQYFYYELLDIKDIFSLIFLTISLIFFILISIYGIKGKLSSMLQRDIS